MIYTIAYDVGTTGLKACLFRIDETYIAYTDDN